MRYCVAGRTLVRTNAGTVRIDAIAPDATANSDAPIDIDVLDRLGRPVHASVLFHSGEHRTLTLRTAEGFELTGTANHPVLCIVELAGMPLLLWRLLGELRPGERVAMNGMEPARSRRPRRQC
jgi:DNA gyrase subunit A